MSKPHYFTTKQVVSGPVSIIAKPAPMDDVKEGKPPFVYKLKAGYGDYFLDSNEIKVSTEEIEMLLPAGIDLLAATVETLKKKKEEVLARAHREATALQDEINSLLMLTYQPDPITGNEPTILSKDEAYGADTYVQRVGEADDDLYF